MVSTHKWPVTRKAFPYHDAFMIAVIIVLPQFVKAHILACPIMCPEGIRSASIQPTRWCNEWDIMTIILQTRRLYNHSLVAVGPSFKILNQTCCTWSVLYQIWKLTYGKPQEDLMLCHRLSMRCLMSWINHLSQRGSLSEQLFLMKN